VAESNSEILACARVSRRMSVVDRCGPAQLLLQIAPIRGSVPRQAIDGTGRRIVKYFTYCHRFCWYQ